MRWIQRNIPSPRSQQTYTQNNFAGGLNNQSMVLQKNEASNVLNMAFSDDDLMEKRKGQEYWETYNITLGGELTFIDEFKPYDDDNQLLRSDGVSLYRNGTLVMTSLSGKISGVNFQGKYFFVDGNKFYVYGKMPQTTTTYERVVGAIQTYYAVFEIVSPPVGYTPLDTSHTRGVTHYDHTALKIWYEPCQNEMTDVHKGANGVPAKPRHLVIKDGRLFVAGSEKENDKIFISATEAPYYFPFYLPMQLPADSDEITGMKVYDNSVVVGRHKDLYAITGSTNRPNMGVAVFELKKLNTHTGFASGSAIDIVHNNLFFMGADGNAYALTSVRGDQRILSTIQLNEKVDFLKKPVSFGKQSFVNASSIFFEDMWYVSAFGKVLVYSYRHKGWTIYEGMHARSYYNLEGVLIWGNSDGKTVKYGAGYYDFGKPFLAFWEGMHIDMGEPHYYKHFLEFSLVTHAHDTLKSDIQVSMEIDYVDVKMRDAVTNQISIFGKAKWGDRFINKNVVISLPFHIGRRGRVIKFKFQNWYEQSYSILTLAELDAVSKSEDKLVYSYEGNKYFLCRNNVWVEQLDEDKNQSMKIYQMHLDYEMRGKR